MCQLIFHWGVFLCLQVPFLFGVTVFEKAACHFIHWIFRRTGRHLFLTDNDEGKSPLLQRMVDDNGDLYFMCVYLQSFSFDALAEPLNSFSYPFLITERHNHDPLFRLCRSALRAFRRRVVYSNVGYDRILCSSVLVECILLLSLCIILHFDDFICFS